MSNDLLKLKPELIWNIFHQLTKIPRPSKKEDKIIEFCVSFGKDNNIDTYVDATNNVIMKRTATSGYENRKTVVLQAHLDMVPQKNSDKVHNFETDPISAYVDGDCVTADGTTLGADNGIGVAAALAVLISTDIKHGPIEVLLTVDEESGMTGAFGLEKGALKGDILLNLDSEEEGELCIGCAGGMDTKIVLPFKRQKLPDGYSTYRLHVKGLRGGHSGVDINLQRGNSNKLLNRILWNINNKFDVFLTEFNGGNLRNAIPREAHSIVSVKVEERAEFENYISNFEKIIKNEYAGIDPEIKIYSEKCELSENVISKDDSFKILNSIYACPNGVMRMIPEIPDVVQLSSNLAIVKTLENEIEVITMQRSSVDSLRDDLGAMIKSVFELSGAEVEHLGEYPGWNPDVDSQILALMKERYKILFNKEPTVKVIHAGLECGLIRDKYPNMDCISFGPTIKFPHSPDEKIEIDTVNKFWDYLISTLENIPEK